jgi:hypothetical protein
MGPLWDCYLSNGWWYIICKYISVEFSYGKDAAPFLWTYGGNLHSLYKCMFVKEHLNSTRTQFSCLKSREMQGACCLFMDSSFGNGNCHMFV